MATLRLDKFLADMQVGTRSQVKDYIKKNRIRVNGKLVSSAELKVDTTDCEVMFDGKRVAYTQTEYYMLNKPAGVLSATMDKKAETVLDLIVDKSRKDLFPVGRLDRDTEGLLLITNDGALAHNLLSPKKHVDKKYFARVSGPIADRFIEEFAKGLRIDEDFTAMPAVLEILGYNSENDMTEVYITIREGKFHQIKRMFEAIGSEVLFLKRLSMGPLVLDKELAAGEYRKLTDEEIEMLYAHEAHSVKTE